MLRNHLEKRQRHGLENVLALVQCSQRRNAAEPLLGQKESWLLCPVFCTFSCERVPRSAYQGTPCWGGTVLIAARSKVAVLSSATRE